MRDPRRPLLLVVAVSGMGCFAHVTSTVEVDGRSFASTWCGSGAPRGFGGIELVDALGRRLRLAQHLDGTAAVAYFPAGSPIGEDLPVCAAVDIRPGNGKINGTRNLDGAATFSCATERHRIVGAVQFENCH